MNGHRSRIRKKRIYQAMDYFAKASRCNLVWLGFWPSNSSRSELKLERDESQRPGFESRHLHLRSPESNLEPPPFRDGTRPIRLLSKGGSMRLSYRRLEPLRPREEEWLEPTMWREARRFCPLRDESRDRPACRHFIGVADLTSLKRSLPVSAGLRALHGQ